MITIDEGQCGLCVHFGENDAQSSKETLIQIRKTHKAPEKLLESCGHPKHAPLNLQVTPLSGCEGFEAAST